ncbi:lanthionine synthetase LanC family protein [Ligilactobacillus murinus]|uniref:lanthionine synthetase LanC family protein n=1 Tax=Ligilactobacillus murinus TaxID=1622 RepID=UPI0013E959AB|nr:lanthionine synthetase LanC family protein [Ligilactobacillus murinus]
MTKWIAIIEKLYTEKNESTKVIQFLDDPQLKKVKNMINPNKMLNQLHLIEDELNSYLLESLSQRDRTLLEKFSKEPSKIVSKFIKNELQSFICQDNMLYLKSGSVYSPYVNGGAAGRLYILVILATKFKLTELFPQLEKFLSKFSGRYVKNATISSGAAGLGMLMLYAYAITGNKEYLQYAYKWNELIEVLSFSLSGKKVWANYQFESKLDESFNNGNAGIRYFQRLLMGENHEFKKGDKC